MSRLSPIDRDALPQSQRRFYDAVSAIRRRPVSGPFIVTMNSSPDLAARIAHLGHYFHARGQADESILPLRVRAFIALIGSRALDAPYEWGAWVNWALEAGVPQDTVEAIREGRTPPHLTDEEKLVSELCTQLITGTHRVSEATFRAALDRYGTQGIVELVVTLGYFAMIAMPLNGFEIEMSAEQRSARKPFAPLPVRGNPATHEDVARRDVPPASDTRAAPRVRCLAGHDDVAPENQHFVDRIVRTRGWIAPVFQALLHTPDVAERIANVGAFLLYESVLPTATRALVGLFAARELDCEYVWAACERLARRENVDGSLIEALEKGKSPPHVPAGDSVALAFCRALLRGNHHVNEPLYQAAVARFGVPATVQLSVLLGYCVMLAFVANTFEISCGNDARPAL